MSINITVICSVHTNIELLPHFLDHYKKFGVTNFVLGIWNGANNPVWDQIAQYNDPTIRLCKSYDEPLSGAPEAAFANRIREELSPNDWYIPADLDEFHVVPGYDNVHDLIHDMDLFNTDFLRGTLVDRTTHDGSIPLHITPTPTIWEQFPNQTNITKSLLWACDEKISLARQSVKILEGHHWTEYFKWTEHCRDGYSWLNYQFKKSSLTHHFKWFGNLLEKEETKLARYKNLGLGYYTENQRLVDHLKSHGGRLF